MPYVFTGRYRIRGLGDLSTVAATIQQIEGWFPGSVSYRNNNPGNLKYAGQPGATGVDANGFAIFPDYATGLQALDNQITLDASRGQTIAQFTSIYAPASDNNNPTSYAAQIASAAGLSPSDLLSAAIGGSSASSSPSSPSSGIPSLSLADLLPSFSDTSDDDSGAPTDNTLLYVGLGLLAGAVVYAVVA